MEAEGTFVAARRTVNDGHDSGAHAAPTADMRTMAEIFERTRLKPAREKVLRTTGVAVMP